MTGLKTLFAAALISAISATSALAQAAISEPAAAQAAYPNRDVLNGGALTPAGRLGLELLVALPERMRQTALMRE